MKKRENTFNTITIILIILLVLRVVMNVAVSSGMGGIINLLSILAVLYLIALIGVLIKQKWGSILVIVLAGLDIISAVLLVSTPDITVIAGLIADLVLIYLGYNEYNQISS